MNKKYTAEKFSVDISPFANCLSNISESDMNSEQLFECKICGLNFINRPISFYKNDDYTKFCKGCGSLNSHRDSEVDFLKLIKTLKSKYQGLYFVSQYRRNELKAVKKPITRKVRCLTTDLAILSTRSLSDLPLAVIEVNAKGYQNTIHSYQDNFNLNYEKKKLYYESKNVPFYQIFYPIDETRCIDELDFKINALLQKLKNNKYIS